MINSEQYKNICTNIRYLRKSYSLSRSVMAHRIGVSVKTLDTIESGIIPARCGAHIFYNPYYSFGVLPSELMDSQLDRMTDEKDR